RASAASTVAASIQSCATLIMTSMINRACHTAVCPGLARRFVTDVDFDANDFKSASILRHRRRSADGPNLAVAHLELDRVKGARRWTKKNLARRGVEGALMTRAFKSLVFAREINGTTQVRALLSE